MAVATVSTPVYDANEAALFRGIAPIVPDGSTDNKQAILDRLNAIANQAGSLGGILQLPAGPIRMASALSWPSTASNIQMVGLGVAVTELVTDHSHYSSTGAGITIGNAVENVRIADLTLRGTTTGDDGGPYDLLLISSSGSNIIAERVLFQFSRHAGFRTSGAAGFNYAALNCRFEDINSSGSVSDGAGVLVNGASGYRFIGCTFRRCGHNTTSHALYVSAGTGVTTTNGVVEGCLFDQTENANCRLVIWDNDSNSMGWTVTGNTFLGPSTATDRFHEMGGRNTFVGNSFMNTRVKVYDGGSVFCGNHFTFTGATTYATRAFEIGGGGSEDIIFANNVMHVTKRPH
jgi:hypothetical protein